MLDQAKANLLRRLCDDWYAGIPATTKAPLIVQQNDHAPGYLKGTIYLFLDGFRSQVRKPRRRESGITNQESGITSQESGSLKGSPRSDS